MKRHAGPGQLQHAQIIGAISNGQDILRREAARGCKLVERGHLCFTAQYGQSHLTGQRVIRLQQPVGPVAIKPKRAATLAVKSVKPPLTRSA